MMTGREEALAILERINSLDYDADDALGIEFGGVKKLPKKFKKHKYEKNDRMKFKIQADERTNRKAKTVKGTKGKGNTSAKSTEQAAIQPPEVGGVVLVPEQPVARSTPRPIGIHSPFADVPEF